METKCKQEWVKQTAPNDVSTELINRYKTRESAVATWNTAKPAIPVAQGECFAASDCFTLVTSTIPANQGQVEARSEIWADTQMHTYTNTHTKV